MHLDIYMIAQLSPIPIVMVAAALRRSLARRDADIATALLFLGYGTIGTYLLWRTIQPGARTLDPALLTLDRALGCDTLAFWRWTAARPRLLALCQGVYGALPPFIAIAWIAEQDRQYRRALVTAGLACFVFYHLFPAIGPAWYVWQTDAALAPVPRNCMPSMHVSSALLAALNARRPLLRTSYWLYTAALAGTVLAMGEHYLVDVLGAIPYCLFCQWATSPAALGSLLRFLRPKATLPTALLKGGHPFWKPRRTGPTMYHSRER